ncbi:hypothetical protein BCR33DRAFT_718429 [Rhizoclosmatium globosum]|uniref:Uncharacterized protein n=1 Tax=Rhizoclosmatium globosum TaxID=329046 RepID=A0A1Y2C5S7_9FUNG|nr:hypothetical protein BCR33DRAFT_718429 [Rhizoclosmatium globosum]|eukprot:ORY42234.1 hypothetical protein BCR33DRAFT_718429 [Rhizoclosmatium globosum]
MQSMTLKKWIALKIYQFEMTFGLSDSVLEPWEKFTLNIVLGLFVFGMIRGIILIPSVVTYAIQQISSI